MIGFSCQFFARNCYVNLFPVTVGNVPSTQELVSLLLYADTSYEIGIGCANVDIPCVSETLKSDLMIYGAHVASRKTLAVRYV